MGQRITNLVIDFTSYIEERTAHFTGCEWLFQAINDWLVRPEEARFFLLSREPGSGKTAIANRLCQFSQRTVPPPDGLTHLTPGFINAMHLCSARDSRCINPRVFAELLAMQLAEHYPGYAKALVEKSGDQQIRIARQQYIGQGQGIGVMSNWLDVSGAAPEEAFNRVVREPHEALFRKGFEQQITILLDALDEALGYSGSANIISLLSHVSELPASVRFILTSHPNSRLENALTGTARTTSRGVLHAGVKDDRKEGVQFTSVE